MNKNLIKTGIIILFVVIVCKLLFVLSRNIKLDEFHKSAVIFLLETTQENKNMLEDEIQYIKTLCANLDPEDDIKILKVADTSYLIFEGSPSDTKGINNSINTYSKSNLSTEADYASAVKKAVEHCLTMKKDGYRPSIVVVGNLSQGLSNSKRINWNTLPNNIKNTQKYIPELVMMFVFAPPEKLDIVKTKLNPVLGEKKLIIANSANIDKANTRFIKAIGR